MEHEAERPQEEEDTVTIHVKVTRCRSCPYYQFGDFWSYADRAEYDRNPQYRPACKRICTHPSFPVPGDPHIVPLDTLPGWCPERTPPEPFTRPYTVVGINPDSAPSVDDIWVEYVEAPTAGLAADLVRRMRCTGWMPDNADLDEYDPLDHMVLAVFEGERPDLYCTVKDDETEHALQAQEWAQADPETAKGTPK